MPTNIFFENLNKEEIIQILRMFEAREEKLQHQIEKLKKKIHAKKETDLAPQEKEQLMKFFQLVPLMDPQELKQESRAFLDIISTAWQDEVLLSNMQRRIQNLQKVKEEILKTDITFQSFGKKNCSHRFVETDTGLKCICCGHSTDEYQLSIHESLYLVEAAKMQGILIRHACIKEIPFLENLAYEQKILKAEDQDKISAKQYEKELIAAREQDLRKVKTPYLNTKESVRFFKKIESEKKEIEETIKTLQAQALVDDEVKRNYDRLLEEKNLALEECLVATYEIYILMGYSVEELYYEEQKEENKYAVVKAYHNLSRKQFQKESGYFRSKAKVDSFTCVTANTEINQMILDLRRK